MGQLLTERYTFLGPEGMVVKMAVPSTVIFIAALLTGLKLFNKITKHTGTGTLMSINEVRDI